MTTYRKMLKDKNGDNILPVTGAAELVYACTANFKKQTYNNAALVLESFNVLHSCRGISATLSSNNRLTFSLPTTGSFLIEVYGQLWIGLNSWDYIILCARKNGSIFARAMAPKPAGSWAFVELTHPNTISNGDYIDWYLNTNGNNFTDGNMSDTDSYMYIKVYQIS